MLLLFFRIQARGFRTWKNGRHFPTPGRMNRHVANCHNPFEAMKWFRGWYTRIIIITNTYIYFWLFSFQSMQMEEDEIGKTAFLSLNYFICFEESFQKMENGRQFSTSGKWNGQMKNFGTILLFLNSGVYVRRIIHEWTVYYRFISWTSFNLPKCCTTTTRNLLCQNSWLKH